MLRGLGWSKGGDEGVGEVLPIDEVRVELNVGHKCTIQHISMMVPELAP